MYNNLLFGVKRRILDEVERAFDNHPAFSGKVVVRNRFPYEERISAGVILRNTAASQIRMSADNYLCDVYSHVRVAKLKNAENTSIEWVRENEANITRWFDDDLSAQVDPTQRLFITSYQMVSGPGNTEYTNNSGQVKITVNGIEARADLVNGKKKQVILSNPLFKGDKVIVSYYRRILAEPGIYQATFNSDSSFSIFPTYEIDNEEVISRTTGTESTATLQVHPIGINSESIFLNFQNVSPKKRQIFLNRDTDYTIDYTTGIITFVHPLEPGYKLTADYYTKVQPALGPFTFKPYQEIHEAVPGVVICMGRRAVEDDNQLIIVSQNKEPQARVFGGHWDMSISLGVIAKDTIQVEEMTDQVVNWLWSVRKNALEFEGITLNRVEPTGESEETFSETTGDLYFESGVDIDLMSEWQKFCPYVYKIRAFDINLTSYVPYTKMVIKVPKVGYETVS